MRMPRKRLVGRKSQVLDEHICAARRGCPCNCGERDVSNVVVRDEESRRHGCWIDLRHVRGDCYTGASHGRRDGEHRHALSGGLPRLHSSASHDSPSRSRWRLVVLLSDLVDGLGGESHRGEALCRYGVLRTFTSVRALPEAKVEALLCAVNELAELESPLPVSPPLLQRLNELVPSDWCAYCELDRVRQRSVFHVWCAGGSVGISTAAWEDDPYWRLREQHPVCGYRERRDDWISARKASDFVTLREFRRREIWSELYRESGVN